MRNKSIFICFTGIDGTGKTTLSKSLVDILKKNKINARYVYARLNPFFLRPFIFIGNKIFLHDSDIFKDYSEYSNKKRGALKKYSFLSKIYLNLLLLDYIIQIFFKIKLPLLLGNNIVCDRYIFDTIITDISIDMNYTKDSIIDSLNHIFTFMPRPDTTFLVDAPEDIAYKRKNDIPSIKYLKERRLMYLNIQKDYDMVILDGSKNLDELQNILSNNITRIL